MERPQKNSCCCCYCRYIANYLCMYMLFPGFVVVLFLGKLCYLPSHPPMHSKSNWMNGATRDCGTSKLHDGEGQTMCTIWCNLSTSQAYTSSSSMWNVRLWNVHTETLVVVVTAATYLTTYESICYSLGFLLLAIPPTHA